MQAAGLVTPARNLLLNTGASPWSAHMHVQVRCVHAGLPCLHAAFSDMLPLCGAVPQDCNAQTMLCHGWVPTLFLNAHLPRCSCNHLCSPGGRPTVPLSLQPCPCP